MGILRVQEEKNAAGQPIYCPNQLRYGRSRLVTVAGKNPPQNTCGPKPIHFEVDRDPIVNTCGSILMENEVDGRDQETSMRNETGVFDPISDQYSIKLSDVTLQFRNQNQQQRHLTEDFSITTYTEVTNLSDNCHSPARTTAPSQTLCTGPHLIEDNIIQHLPSNIYESLADNKIKVDDCRGVPGGGYYYPPKGLTPTSSCRKASIEMKLGNKPKIAKDKIGYEKMRNILKPKKSVGSKATKKLLSHEVKGGMLYTLKPKNQHTLMELWGPESVIDDGSSTTTQIL